MPGVTATATRRDNVLVVPNTALRFSPTVASASATQAAKKTFTSSLLPRMPGGSRRSASAGASTAGAKQVGQGGPGRGGGRVLHGCGHEFGIRMA